MCPPCPVLTIIIYGYLLFFGNAARQLPEGLLNAFAVVLDLRIVVKLFADKLIQLRSVLAVVNLFSLSVSISSSSFEKALEPIITFIRAKSSLFVRNSSMCNR